MSKLDFNQIIYDTIAAHVVKEVRETVWEVAQRYLSDDKCVELWNEICDLSPHCGGAGQRQSSAKLFGK